LEVTAVSSSDGVGRVQECLTANGFFHPAAPGQQASFGGGQGLVGVDHGRTGQAAGSEGLFYVLQRRLQMGP
jgi:hypothetical protein